MLSDVGLRHAAEDRLSRRGRRAPASGEDLEADRAGDDGVRPRHLGEPRAARARLHRVRDRRRAEAGDAVQGERPGGRRAGDQAGDRARGAPHAGDGGAGRRHRAARAGRRAIASAARPAPRTSSKAAATREQVRVVVRRLRAGVESAPGGRGDDRRADGRPVLRRRRRGAGVLEGDGRRAAHARRAARRAGRQRDPAAPTAPRCARKRDDGRARIADVDVAALLARLGVDADAASPPTAARVRDRRRVRRVSRRRRTDGRAFIARCDRARRRRGAVGRARASTGTPAWQRAEPGGRRAQGEAGRHRRR